MQEDSPFIQKKDDKHVCRHRWREIDRYESWDDTNLKTSAIKKPIVVHERCRLCGKERCYYV